MSDCSIKRTKGGVALRSFKTGQRSRASRLTTLTSTLLLFQIYSLLTTPTNANNDGKISIPDDESPLVKMSDYVPPTVPATASYFYPSDYRILNCWECFEAHGKICMDEDYGFMG